MIVTLWLWGKGGYYTLGWDGYSLSVPAGEAAYRRLAQYAPASVVERVIRGLEALHGG